MAWRIESTASVSREMDKLSSVQKARIFHLLSERLAVSDDPRISAKASSEREYGGLWRYRVDDHRIIADIRDRTVSILVVKIGHRREVYRT